MIKLRCSIKTGFLFSVIIVPLAAYVLHDYLIYPATLFLVDRFYRCGYGLFWCGAHGIKMSIVSVTTSFTLSTVLILLSRKFLHTIGFWREYILGIIYMVAILPINLALVAVGYAFLPNDFPFPITLVLLINTMLFLLLLIKTDRHPKISKK